MKRIFAVAVVALVMGAIGGSAAAVGVFKYSHAGGSAYFWDCNPTSPHDQNIGWAAEYPIVQGYWDDSYRPTQTVTREQMATFLMRQTPLDYNLAALCVDYIYFNGAMWGADAYATGDITWEQYQAYVDAIAWAAALEQYQITNFYSVAGKGKAGMPTLAGAALAAAQAQAVPRREE